MKHILGSILLIVLLNFYLSGKAQNENNNISDTALKSFLKFKISWESGSGWEQRIGKVSVLELLGGISIGRQTDNFFDFKARSIFTPTSLIEYRNYYNLVKRIKNKKRIKNNSADFLFGRVQTYYPVKDQNYFGLLFIEGWGIQRSINKRIGFDLHAGVLEHLFYDKPPGNKFNYVRLEPSIGASIFYAFFKY